MGTGIEFCSNICFVTSQICAQIWDDTSSSSSCSGRIRFDSCSLYPQNEIWSLHLFLGRPMCLRHLVCIVVLVQVSCLCPSSVCVVATFPGTVLFPLLGMILKTENFVRIIYSTQIFLSSISYAPTGPNINSNYHMATAFFFWKTLKIYFKIYKISKLSNCVKGSGLRMSHIRQQNTDKIKHLISSLRRHHILLL